MIFTRYDDRNQTENSKVERSNRPLSRNAETKDFARLTVHRVKGWTGKNKAFCSPGTQNGRRVKKVSCNFFKYSSFFPSNRLASGATCLQIMLQRPSTFVCTHRTHVRNWCTQNGCCSEDILQEQCTPCSNKNRSFCLCFMTPEFRPAEFHAMLRDKFFCYGNIIFCKNGNATRRKLQLQHFSGSCPRSMPPMCQLLLNLAIVIEGMVSQETWESSLLYVFFCWLFWELTLYKT